jgi:hypothetical protein
MVSKRRVFRGFGAGALSAYLLVAGPVAHAGEWLTDAKSGCQVWDPNPQLEESVVWWGPCANGHADGRGTVKWQKGNDAIETDQGEWRDGRQSGRGVQNWPVGRYEGDLADGLPNGNGVLTFQKYRYEGQFRDGKPDGIGTLTSGSQSVQGTWKGGCLQGQRKASIGIPLKDCR